MNNVLVIGDGAMGTALGLLMNAGGARVCVWGAFPQYCEEVSRTRENKKFLPEVTIPESVDWISGDSNPALTDTEYELVIIAVPTQFIRSVLERIRGFSGQLIVSAAKGLEKNTLLRPSQIIFEQLGRDDIVVLSGPSHAEEIAEGLPTTVVAASADIEKSRRVQRLMTHSTFRVYSGSDQMGVELGGALKNVIAVAAGICDGYGYGDNTKAALITRGLAEMVRLGTALGARPETFSGLSGIGDLITTCISPHGRNLAFGREIGRGKSVDQVQKETEKVTEGVWTSRAALALARKYDVEMPITEQVVAILFDGTPPAEAVKILMGRELKEEFV